MEQTFANEHKFIVFSLNVQSMHAKFNHVVAFMEIPRERNIRFQVIGMQMSLLGKTSDLSLVQIGE